MRLFVELVPRIRGLIILLVAMAVGGSVASATPTIISMASSIDRGLYYLGDPDVQWKWEDRQVIDGSILTEDYQFFYFHGTADWVSDLYVDSSGPPEWAEGRANATFLGGGTLSITGTFEDSLHNELYTGLLFQATVKSWELLETGVDTNNFDTVGDVVVCPKFGYLVDGQPGNSYAVLRELYSFALSFPAALSQPELRSDPVVDFQHNLWATAGSQWIMAHQLPEPGTVLLLGMGLLGLLARSRRRI